ncbi:MAG: YihY/virulence factor BrkB family protein [Candidatus Eremiobacteraeota bacterium]|nr:YihY/virulence factor BrkB family protein [Candidatus Eremiobacteraeota bacterium]
MGRWIPLLRETWGNYQRHNAQWLAAALAYFAAFAVAPLIIVVVEIAGFFVHSHQHVLDVIFNYIQRDVGSGSDAVRQIVATTFNQPRRSVLAQIVGWALFVLAALGLFGSLQFALNTAWGADQAQGLWQNVRQKVAGFAMMVIVAALLLASVFANAVLATASAYLAHLLAGLATFAQIADFIMTFALVWLLFAMLFRYLPNCRIGWRDVWVGAGITALLFTIGQFLLGWYLGRAGLTSTYGAFGSLVAFLLWANYSAQIFLFGAEFTHVYATHHGTRSAGGGAELKST